MKLHTSWITLMGAGALLVTGLAAARQTAPTPAPTPAPAPQAAAAPTAPAPAQAVFQTRQGEVTVRSALPPPPPAAAAPPFEQLSGGGKFISVEQAKAYPPLANDFDYADSNHDHRISAAEYARWTRQQ